jgi:hypothetical protein
MGSHHLVPDFDKSWPVIRCDHPVANILVTCILDSKLDLE